MPGQLVGIQSMPSDQDTPAPHSFLERSAVPLEFPQFRNSGALAHLAHMGRGPRYVVVGGRAWYDPQDVRAWLELNKRCGPKRDLQLSEPNPSRAADPVRPKKRGRPTKLEQMLRQSAAFPLRFER
jgi:hypothetical protein